MSKKQLDNKQLNRIKRMESYLDEAEVAVKELASALEKYEKFENNEGLFLYGSNGVGKSLLASIVVKEAYRQRYTSKRVSFMEYISEYTRIWDSRNKEEREELEAHFYNDYKAVEFLVIEEVGKEIDSKIAVAVLEDCLRYREEKGLPTIICTNLTPQSLVDKYGNSIASLIKGNFTPIQIVGSDKRKEHFGGKSDAKQ